MSEKLRVNELAKELGLPNKDVITALNEKIGVNVKAHSSSITREEADKLIAAMKKPAKTSAASLAEQKAKMRPSFINEPVKAPVEKAKRAVKLIKKKPKVEEPPKEEVKPAPAEEVKAETPKIQEAPKPVEQAKQPEKSAQQIAQEQVRKIVKRVDKPNAIPKIEVHQKQPPRPVKEEPKKADGAKATEKPGESDDKKFKKPIKRHIIAQEPYAKGKKGRKLTKQEKLDEKEKQFQQQQAKARKKEKAEKEIVEKVKEVVINQPLTVGDLALKIHVSTAEIVREAMMMGVLATVNQIIDVDTATKICEKLEIEVSDIDLEALEKEIIEEEKEVVIDKNAIKRAPVVTIMGHVDHGKTTLLDSIRASKHKIVSTEVGGITQSIGAYTVEAEDNKKIVFIDTPGHETFTEMRARGAQATDIAILVVAADDGIMPQTIESINHAKAAKVPIIIAVNKMDKEDANPDKVLQQLTEHGLVPEEWGGDTICVKVSALQGMGIDELLEYILLVADMQELKANPNVAGAGVVIEANLDKGKGPVATLLVQNGSLKVGDSVAINTVGGRVRALISDSGERVKEAGPSTPVEILGLSGVPQAGDKFEVCESEKKMKALIDKKQQEERQSKLESIMPAQVKTDTVEGEETKEMNIIIKANTHGSAEAVSAAVQQLSSKSIITNIVHIAVGDISEADVMLAAASNAVVIGFSVKEDQNALQVAEKQGVTIKKYEIIYEILEDVEKTMLGLLAPEYKEVQSGMAEVRQVFTVGKTTKIAGCYVLEGKVLRNAVASVERGNKEIFKGPIDQLKRFKDDVKEVATGYECGISFAKFNDLEEGDIINVFTTEEIKKESLK